MSNKISFTICSNNYLAQANALKTSFLKHNPDFQFYIILVDKRSNRIDYSIFEPAKLLTVAQIDTIDLDYLIDKYDIIELNTSIKATVFKYLSRENKDAQAIYYLDPDLYFYASLDETNDLLKNKAAVFTPHILSPIERDGNMPDENIFLNFGIYNLGFLGVNPSNENTIKMLDWWEERTTYHGYDRPKVGYFVDQLWMNLAPVFYDDMVVLKTYNYNMGPWNLHERHILSINNDEVLLNDNSKLVFYHFSKLANNDNDVSREYNRFTLKEFPLLKELYIDYKSVVKESNYDELRTIPIAYNIKIRGEEVIPERSFLKKVLKKISWYISTLANKL